MDILWAKGWRHFGSYFYRYSHLPKNDVIYSVLSLRIKLSEFKASKSQKRVINKNKDLEVIFKPAFVNQEVKDLFERHKQKFKENVPDSIYVFVSKKPASIPCECQSLCIYKEGKLIAISYLDIGETSSSSIYQCYDPNEAKRSLGVFMILESIRHSKKLNKDFYYPGYAYKEASHYDYKKRFAATEYFDWESAWLPLPKS